MSTTFSSKVDVGKFVLVNVEADKQFLTVWDVDSEAFLLYLFELSV